ncbi:MOSC N-terminal beta barrel domain-containing protein [Streptomyces sp. RKAG290]|uniref:MOSC domain-containing protein n=1 Tax=Streptomyces sp. RKAG290 TaxID=2888348 RepID=UPI0020334946|nr:MOSC N-terminal beta barrel domain-containing protein [Streptomyces sp. RKAG290]MCM2415729.1 MOSC domain-containing protein [Streptomyces sp. RKAG290]
MLSAVLSAVHIHPVKSLAACATDEAAVEPWGLDGDRRWMLVDATGTAVTQRQQPRMAQIHAAPLPGGGIGLSAPGSAALTVEVPEPGNTVGVVLHGSRIEVVEAAHSAHVWFSEHLGAQVRLVHLDAPGRRRPIGAPYGRPGETVSLADGFPLLLTSGASLDALNSLITRGDHPGDGPLPMDRFRPSVVVDGTAAWAEDGWSRISIGDVPFRVVEPCGRCVITTIDQRTARRGKEPLHTLARHRRSGRHLLFGQNLIPDAAGLIRVGDPVRILG